MSNQRFGCDIPGPRAIIIGDIPVSRPRWSLHDYDTGATVTGPHEAESYDQCTKRARAWFLAHGGRERWPNGLQMRSWNT